MKKKEATRIIGWQAAVGQKFLCLMVIFCFMFFSFARLCLSQPVEELEYGLDLDSANVALPNIFRPNIDLSGRGFHRQPTWPQALAAEEVLQIWEKEIGFAGMYRMQYNLWRISEFAKDKEAQDKLLANYEKIIQKITDAGGVVILDLFGMPAGMGEVLDKRSPAADLKPFKKLVKEHIRRLSCEKKFNIWYEVWSAPDLDSFFLGREQDYLNLYRAVSESVKELEQETKMHIPVGGPSISWWFQSFDGNTTITPERSLIYALIRFCARSKLPLNFISWHAYSTDPKAEKELTRYNKSAVNLIRDWLGYFNLDKSTPLIIDEWNYDSGTNILPERYEKSNIGASYILSRLKNMHEAGIDYQLYFCLEDFYDIKEGVIRNVGLFWFDQIAAKYKGSDKPTYNIFRMLYSCGSQLFTANKKLDDEFVGALATKSQQGYVLFFYNYIDPEIVTNFLSRNIASLNSAERKSLLGFIRSDKLTKIIRGEMEIDKLRITKKEKALLKKAQARYIEAVKAKSFPRRLKLSLKNLKGDYTYQSYTVDASCGTACEFAPLQEKEIAGSPLYQEELILQPYSVTMIVLKRLPPQQKEQPPAEIEQLPTEERPQQGTGEALEPTAPAAEQPAATQATVNTQDN